MSNKYIDWATDLAIDRAIKKAEELKMDDDDDLLVDKLIEKELEGIMEENNGAA